MFRNAFIAALLISPLAWSAQTLRGDYQGYGFTVRVQPRQTATLTWDDGTPGFQGTYQPHPNPAPKCPCEVYEALGTDGQGPVVRQISIEFDLSTGEYTTVHYSKRPLPRLRGSHQGQGFTVTVLPLKSLTLRWDDGYPGFTATYQPHPNPAPRCPCESYEHVSWERGRRVVRRVDLETDTETGEYQNPHYSKW